MNPSAARLRQLISFVGSPNVHEYAERALTVVVPENLRLQDQRASVCAGLFDVYGVVLHGEQFAVAECAKTSNLFVNPKLRGFGVSINDSTHSGERYRRSFATTGYAASGTARARTSVCPSREHHEAGVNSHAIQSARAERRQAVPFRRGALRGGRAGRSKKNRGTAG